MKDIEKSTVLVNAQAMVESIEAKWTLLGTRQVRVTRVLVYEGPADRIRNQLANSLAEGQHTFGRPGLEIDIAVYQDELKEPDNA